MALNRTNKMAWMVETIRKAGRISFNDLNQKWIDNDDMSQGKPLPKRTLHNWKNAILDTFGILIECEQFGLYRYYIANPEDLKGNSMEQWLLDTYAVSNSLMENKSIKDRIILENIPSGREYLDIIIDAMRNSQVLQITYYNYWRDEAREYKIDPYCVKLFRQRWYVVAHLHGVESPLIFCLDRIRKLFSVEGEKYVYPASFSPEEFFSNCFGVMVGYDIKAEKVVLKVAASQANYLRDLPLHPSQEETERHKDYSFFTLYLRPTFDLKQELLWNGDFVEVLKPTWFRKEMAELIEKMNNKYKG